MKKTRMLLMAATMAMAGAAQAASPSPPQVEYSADSVIETAEVSMKGRVHYTPTHERREMVMGRGGDTQARGQVLHEHIDHINPSSLPV